MTLPAATLDTPLQLTPTHLQVHQPDVSRPVFFDVPAMAQQQAAVTGSQMVSVPIFEGDKGTGVISWCESLDRSQV